MEEKLLFEKLTPRKDAELKIYADALKYVFANDDVRNVAISGAYGAGKSSLVESYKAKQKRKILKRKRFIHISLAHFNVAEKTGDSSDVGASTIEGKILNQLIHQIKPKRIPQTHFKVKRRISRFSNIKVTALLLMLIVLALFIVFSDAWVALIETFPAGKIQEILKNSAHPYARIGAGVGAFAIVAWFLNKVIKYQRNKGALKKVKAKDYEIEVFEESKESYFDKYLNEVLYLFENAKADVVVFEDMDRFDTVCIFEKLREINTLINNKRTRKSSIRFFYLLRDDIFDSKDRTKFFDFLIPVVPVIDGSNSYDQFIAKLKERKIFELFTQDFLRGFSLYIDDMRLLINICNEFIIYFERFQLTDIELDCDRLLAMIAYKNLFPRDYSDLQLGRGFVHAVFESKNRFIADRIDKINEEIESIDALILAAENSLASDIDELDYLFLRLPNDRLNYCIKNKTFEQHGSNIEGIKAMKAFPDDVTCYNTTTGRTEKVNISKLLADLESDLNYLQRRQQVEAKSDAKKTELYRRKQSLQEQVMILRHKKLAAIITMDDFGSVQYENEIGDVTNFEQIKSAPYFALIKFLIKNGYIDETYSDYMNYFYEHSISRSDKIFLRSITDEVKKSPDYELRDPALVVSMINLAYYDHPETLNYQLLEYLLNTKAENAEKLEKLMRQIIQNKDFGFINNLLDRDNENALFIAALNNMWKSSWDEMYLSEAVTMMQKKRFVLLSLYHTPGADLRRLNSKGRLTRYISQNDTFLDIDSPDVAKLISCFEPLEVMFRWIDFDRSHNDLFAAVYSRSMYALSFDMIELILLRVYGIEDRNQIKHMNYTLIASDVGQPLYTYVKGDLDEYLHEIVEHCDGKIEDDIECIIDLLNDKSALQDSKGLYIEHLCTTLPRINAISCIELWRQLLNKCVAKTYQNALDFFFNHDREIDGALAQFLNSIEEDFSFSNDSLDKGYGKNAVSAFFVAVVRCMNLTNEAYRKVVGGLRRIYQEFSIVEIDDSKMSILIDSTCIIMNADNLQFMRDNYPQMTLQFILHNIDKYVDEVKANELFSNDELLKILGSDISDEHKLALLKITNTEVSINNPAYSQAVIAYIINNNFVDQELSLLLSRYPKQGKALKCAIVGKAIDHIDAIINYEFALDYDLYTELMSASSIDKAKKEEILRIALHTLSEEQAKKSFADLHLDEYLRVLDGKRPNVEISPFSESVLKTFKHNRWISSFSEDKEKPGFYRAIGRKRGNDASA